ncbi:MAG TPA: endonuclease/exonuclease/phosphatase family protein [Rhizobiaceae bacterium]|nr:endonuclease/exonuclease/phosphatase family protein [Rhizobiaceae bacterium]
MTIRILSLNAWGGKLHELLMPYLKAADADVFCLQEVVRTTDAPSEWLTYRDSDRVLPQRANMFDELRALLPGHDGFFCPTARGELFDENERRVLSEFGLATFVRTSLPVIGQALDFVYGEFSPGGWGARPRARNAHVVRIFDYEKSAPLTVAHMHGLHDPAGKGDTQARVKQADAFVEIIRSVWRPGERLVVCGDFNVLPGSVTFDALAALGLYDLVTARGFTDTRTSHYAKPQRFADYMLVTPDVEVKRFDVVAEPEVADHRALLLEIG